MKRKRYQWHKDSDAEECMAVWALIALLFALLMMIPY